MKCKRAATCFVLGAALAPVAFAAASDTDRNKPATFVKDSANTTKIKTKLAAENPASMATIHVDTDRDGVVWMSNTAKTQQDVDKAAAIAKNTEGVKSVKDNVEVRHWSRFRQRATNEVAAPWWAASLFGSQSARFPSASGRRWQDHLAPK